MIANVRGCEQFRCVSRTEDGKKRQRGAAKILQE
jgi:hypothetical protein